MLVRPVASMLSIFSCVVRRKSASPGPDSSSSSFLLQQQTLSLSVCICFSVSPCPRVASLFSSLSCRITCLHFYVRILSWCGFCVCFVGAREENESWRHAWHFVGGGTWNFGRQLPTEEPITKCVIYKLEGSVSKFGFLVFW